MTAADVSRETADPLGLISLRVSEVFGPTWQGEGPHAGRRCHFLRTGLCNLTCQWCDTPFTWDRNRYDLEETCPPMAAGLVRDMLLEADASLVVVSGGEPLIHKHQLRQLVKAMPEIEWHLETNGTIPPDPEWPFAHTTISPKVGTMDPRRKRLKFPVLEQWRDLAHEGLAAFKFVARNASDVGLAAMVVEQLDLDADRVWIMPEGTTAEKVMRTHRAIAAGVMAEGFNTTTRLHTLLWDDERGR